MRRMNVERSTAGTKKSNNSVTLGQGLLLQEAVDELPNEPKKCL